MDQLTLATENSWCPGCGNFLLFDALKKAIGKKEKEFVIVSGIGCHAKMADYININSFYGLHGRAIPVAQGIKIGNPNLKVIASCGDGDAYNEGISHLIHAAKRNSDITVIIHDNHNFALTVKQFTSTSPEGFKGSSTPEGSIEEPFNPLELMISSGATFVARGYVGRKDHLEKMIKEGIKHKGFSFIEILQPCVAWYNTFEKYNKTVYEEETEEPSSREKALTKAALWDYKNGDKVPIGVFYKINKETFEEKLLKNA